MADSDNDNAIFGPSPMDETDYIERGEIPPDLAAELGLNDDGTDAKEASSEAKKAEAEDAADEGQASEETDEEEADEETEEDEEDAEEQEAELDENSEDYAELGRRVRRMLDSDPKALAKAVLDMLPEDQRKELLAASPGEEEADLTQPLGAPDPNDLEGRWERAVAARLNAIPEAIEKQTVEQMARVAPYVDSAAASSTIALRYVRALADAIGISLPEIKVDDVSKAALTGKKTWEEAVEAVAGKALKRTVERAKRARGGARPATIGAQGRGAPEAVFGDSLEDIARKMFGGG